MKTLLASLLLCIPCFAETVLYEVAPKPGKTDEFLTITGPTFGTLKNVRIVKANALEVRVMHDDGVATLQTASFPESIRRALGAGNPEAVRKAIEEKADRERSARVDAAARMNGIKAENARAAGNEAKSTSIPTETLEVDKDVVAGIKERAAKEWPQDHSMQQYVLRKETAAWVKLDALKKTGTDGIPSAEFDKVIAKAVKEWEPQWGMVIYEIEKQAKAYKALHP